MSYTLWLKIESDDDGPDSRDEGWTSLGVYNTRKDVEDAGDRARKILGNAGYDSDPLEGWHHEPDEEDMEEWLNREGQPEFNGSFR